MIEVHGLARDYASGDGRVQALRGVDLRVERGEMVAVMGASGSGKSTLMNLLGCLDRPTAGTYRLDGVAVDQLDDDALSRIRNERLGFVFQGFHLLARTSALENVELPLLYDRRERYRDSRGRALRALERVGLADRVHHVPNALSGGQQQRVAIARALVTEPRLLLADEPTGNLDSQTTLGILALLQGLNDEGITQVLVTHEEQVARHCQRVVVLKDGRVLTDEPVSGRLRATADEILAPSAPAVPPP